jgi:hypothetical protein
MKKLWLSILAAFVLLNFSYAQNTDPWPQNGPIGIGTTSPASGLMLDVIGNGSFSGTLSLGSGGAATNIFQQTLAHNYFGISGVSYPGQFRWYASPNNSLYKDNALFQLRSWDAGTNTENTMATFTGGGNLGIGTLPTGGRLHVLGAAGLSPIYLAGETVEGEFLTATKSNGSYATHFYTSGGNNATDQALRVGNAQGSTLFTSLYNGNFGIGTPIPNVKLQVNSNNSGTGYNDWITANFGAATGDRVVIGLLDGTATIGAHNNILTAWADIAINPSGGRVGIGTKTPSAALDVGGHIQISSTDAASPPADLSYGLFPYSGIGLGIFSGATGSNQGIGFWTNPNGNKTEVLRINANGNVGIGITNPYAKFHLNSTGSTSNAIDEYTGDMIIQGNPGNRTGTTGASLEFVIPANTDGANPWGQGRIITVAGNSNSFNATGKMILGTRRMFDKGVGTGTTWNYGDDLVIDGNGNVGIGTSTPSSPLQIQTPGASGSVQLGPWVAGSTAGSIYLNNDFTTPNNYNFLSAISSPLYINRPSGQDILFREGNAPASQMVILSGGNVAIGTNDPKGYKLAVAGNAIAEQMTVKLQVNWPDYIFKKDYTLMPLADLKNYIDQNHHLPEIPSAAEVKKDGLNLGEMNGLLVKKVEELTLYLLEKEKEINDLKADKKVKDEQDRQQNERLKKLEEQLNTLLKDGK